MSGVIDNLGARIEATIENVHGGAIIQPEIHLSNGLVKMLRFEAAVNGYYFSEQNYTSELDAAYPNGIYTITGMPSWQPTPLEVPLTLQGTYPQPSVILNLSEIRAGNPSDGVLLEWEPFVDPSPYRYITITIRSGDLSGLPLYQSGPLDPSLTSYWIPPFTLPGNRILQGEITFFSPAGSKMNYQGADIAVAYASTVLFRFPSQITNPTESVILFFGPDLYIYPGNQKGTSQWYFSYTFKNMFHYSGSQWFFFEEFGAHVWADIQSGTPAAGFWSYVIFPDGHSSWCFMGRDGNFYDLRDTNKNGIQDIPNNAAGNQVLNGYIFLQTPFPSDGESPSWYYFTEADDGNWLINTSLANPTATDWHRLK